MKPCPLCGVDAEAHVRKPGIEFVCRRCDARIRVTWPTLEKGVAPELRPRLAKAAHELCPAAYSDGDILEL